MRKDYAGIFCGTLPLRLLPLYDSRRLHVYVCVVKPHNLENMRVVQMAVQLKRGVRASLPYGVNMVVQVFMSTLEVCLNATIVQLKGPTLTSYVFG